MFGDHAVGEFVAFFLVVVYFFVPEGVEGGEFVLVGSVEVVLFLAVFLLHLEYSAGLELPLELL